MTTFSLDISPVWEKVLFHSLRASPLQLGTGPSLFSNDTVPGRAAADFPLGSTEGWLPQEEDLGVF